jgi:hypothetical protein
MRMARVNITIPDELLDRARAAGLNVSRVTASALLEELDRRERIAALDSYLQELDATLGPVPSSERDAAAEWADRMLDDAHPPGRADATHVA